MPEIEITKILNIFDENNLSCFHLNSDNATIIISNDLNDEMLYNEMDILSEELQNNGYEFVPEGNLVYLNI